MKLFHISDLHIGKRVNGLSMVDDQKHILGQILLALERELPQALLISGDVYDKSVPSAEAVTMFDDFLCRVQALGIQVFLIGGNHDSIERLSFGHRLMENAGVHIAPVYSGALTEYELQDEYGPVQIWLMPFIRPADVRRYFPEANIENYQDAVQTVLENTQIDNQRRNVLLSHQFVTGAQLCDSEEFNVGGLDNVAWEVYGGFDYVALGHIHGAQYVGAEHIRYCGSPLKYSFSEEHHQKSITVVSLGEKGDVHIHTLPLVPLRDLRTLRGSFEELMDPGFYATQATQDYLRIELTDEEEVPEAIGRLRCVYTKTMLLDYDNARTRSASILQAAQAVAAKQPIELFRELYAQQNNQPMTDTQEHYLQNLLDDLGRESL